MGLLPEIGLVELADRSLPERLAGKVSEQLEEFASQMRHGLLAASVAIALGDGRTCRRRGHRGGGAEGEA